MRVIVTLPEPGQALTVWALEHPAFRDLIWIGERRPKPGDKIDLGIPGTELAWDESMLVKAEVTVTAWRHVEETGTIILRCQHCGRLNDSHDPTCPVLIEKHRRRGDHT